MISQGAVEVPGNHRPLLGPVPIEGKKMILVETVPMLHQDAGREVSDIFIHIETTVEEIEQVGGARQIVAKGLQVSQTPVLLSAAVVMTFEGGFRAKTGC